MKHNSFLNKSLNFITDYVLFSEAKFKFDLVFFKRLNLLLILAIASMVSYMFSLKSFVQDLNFEKNQITSQIDNEKTQINLLNAEYAYLSSPERLRSLSKKYLNLEEINPTQILADNNDLLPKTRFLKPNNNNKKWRYKKTDVLKTSGSKKIGR